MLAYVKGAFYNYIYGTILQKAVVVRGTPPLEQVGGDAKGLTIIVTGPTSGIGWATAAELARRGAHVVLACRSSSKGEAMVKKLEEEAAAAGRAAPSLEVNLLDLASLESVRQFVHRWEQQQRPLHVLVNNAGMFNMGVGRSESPDGIEVHMQTNHLSHFLLTLGLLPALQRAAQQQQQQDGSSGFVPRIVNVASSMHHMGYKLRQDPEMQHYSAELAYGNSKLAQVLFIAELNRRLPAAGVQVAAIAVHPGNALTDVVRSLPEIAQILYRAIMTQILLTPEEGSRASVYAATDPAAPTAAAATHGYLDCSTKPVQPNAAAGDAELAAWMWRWSKERVQLPDKWDVPPPASS